MTFTRQAAQIIARRQYSLLPQRHWLLLLIPAYQHLLERLLVIQHVTPQQLTLIAGSPARNKVLHLAFLEVIHL